jgi:hypothetical protein
MIKGEGELHTKDEFLGRGEHIYSEGHLILIDLQAEPSNQGRREPDQRRHD